MSVLCLNVRLERRSMCARREMDEVVGVTGGSESSLSGTDEEQELWEETQIGKGFKRRPGEQVRNIPAGFFVSSSSCVQRCDVLLFSFGSFWARRARRAVNAAATAAAVTRRRDEQNKRRKESRSQRRFHPYPSPWSRGGLLGSRFTYPQHV